MKPVIGLTVSFKGEEYFLNQAYCEAVIATGGIPFLLPTTNNPQILFSYLLKTDGLILTGGEDINPLLFGENPIKGLGKVDPARDYFEINLCRLFLAYNKPLLGICRGLQILNVATGGGLYQDLNSQGLGNLQHIQNAPKNHQSHHVYLEKSSLLSKLLKTTVCQVNSFHHQGVKHPAKGYLVAAKAEDGVIEGIEGEDGFAIGVQWHPEHLWRESNSQKELFLGLIAAAKGKIKL